MQLFVIYSCGYLKVCQCFGSLVPLLLPLSASLIMSYFFHLLIALIMDMPSSSHTYIPYLQPRRCPPPCYRYLTVLVSPAVPTLYWLGLIPPQPITPDLTFLGIPLTPTNHPLLELSSLIDMQPCSWLPHPLSPTLAPLVLVSCPAVTFTSIFTTVVLPPGRAHHDTRPYTLVLPPLLPAFLPSTLVISDLSHLPQLIDLALVCLPLPSPISLFAQSKWKMI